MSYSTHSRSPQPLPGLKLTVQFVISERNGQPYVTIRPVVGYRCLISPVGNCWLMPWEERLQSTVTLPPEREELCRHIRDQILWRDPAGGVQVTDGQIVLKGIHEVLLQWRMRAQRAESRDQRRSWCQGPVMAKKAEQFIGLFRLVEMEGIEWTEVKLNRDGWGDVLKELVKGRREVVVGQTRRRALPWGEFDVDQEKVMFWSSSL